ncbi:GAF and ANTAR domain-containing protein [Pseudokineococcus basanitobsidens]|uniref:GAF and ANTAR domain-containing protein n=1 Tax=Pseudokineococcus basanitobsidens TaxID=1926649 RepID=A0ABU8RMY4_9ACTN
MTAQQRLAEVFVELADTLVDDFDVVEFLTMLTERCVELLDADAAGLMLADQRGSLQLVASTAHESRQLEVFELQADQGPCLESFSTGRQVVNVGPDESAQRWPRFAAAARGAGFASAHALPLRLRGQVLGGLNLFTVGERRLTDEDTSVGQAMADIATISLLQERSLREQTRLSEQLQGALDSRITVEQAKGVLAAKTGLSVPEAFTAMRRHARGHGLPLGQVATAVVHGRLGPEQILPGTTSPPGPGQQRQGQQRQGQQGQGQGQQEVR